MKNNKFKLLENDTKHIGGVTLYRIEALRDFGHVKNGDKGGYIKKESNLSHEGNACVVGNALISKKSDVITIGPVGSEDGTLTAYRGKDGKIRVTRGCFEGTLEDFEKAVNETHGDSKHARVYKLAIELIKIQLFQEAKTEN